jgi:putative SOS response-associated peptidase YedK
MCNSYISRFNYTELVDAFARLKAPVRFPRSDRIPNLQPNEDIRPTDPCAVVVPTGGGAEVVTLRWGFPPPRPKAGPIINFRSEGRRFDKGRCLIPASAFHEFTGTRYPKVRWRFTKSGEDLLCIAGLWRPARGEEPACFTMLTTEPGPDVAPFHDRQIVILERDDWAEWLFAESPDPRLLAPLRAGSLDVTEVVAGKHERLL